MIHRLTSLLRSERGDADPLTTIAAIAISAVMAGIVAGAISLITTTAADYASDQSSAASERTAQSLFQQDAMTASEVTGSSTASGATEVVFTDALGGSGVTVGQATDCRQSEWSVSGSTLTDTVTVYQDQSCTGGDPSASTTAVTVTGLATGASFDAVNSVGEAISYPTGTTPGAGAVSGTGCDNTTWCDADDSSSTQPALITMDTSVAGPGGTNPEFILTGKTDLRPKSLTDTVPGSIGAGG